MPAGYVYVLENDSMPGMIKVGRTLRDTRSRVRELNTTGVPSPFRLAFEIFTESCEDLEKSVHDELCDFRVSKDREFFRYPLHRAIDLVQRLAAPTTLNQDAYVAEDILERLKKRYPEWLRSDIVGVRIVQSRCRVWLEITSEHESAEYLVDQRIHRMDLAFITENGVDLLFPSKDPVSQNAARFVEEFDAYAIIMTTDLFHKAACEHVAENLNPNTKKA